MYEFLKPLHMTDSQVWDLYYESVVKLKKNDHPYISRGVVTVLLNWLEESIREGTHNAAWGGPKIIVPTICRAGYYQGFKRSFETFRGAQGRTWGYVNETNNTMIRDGLSFKFVRDIRADIVEDKMTEYYLSKIE